MTIDMANNSVKLHNIRNEPWKVTLLYTGPDTQTGGRLLRAKDYLFKERFMLTYGDGVSDVNISELVKTHEKFGKMITLTAVQPAGRFSSIENKFAGCELSLWQTNVLLEIIALKGNGFIDNRQWFSVQDIQKKDISYGFFNVFYINYLGLFRKYLSIKILTDNTYNYLRKHLLFYYFLIMDIKF